MGLKNLLIISHSIFVGSLKNVYKPEIYNWLIFFNWLSQRGWSNQIHHILSWVEYIYALCVYAYDK